MKKPPEGGYCTVSVDQRRCFGMEAGCAIGVAALRSFAFASNGISTPSTAIACTRVSVASGSVSAGVIPASAGIASSISTLIEVKTEGD